MSGRDYQSASHSNSFINAESIFSALASDKRLGIINELYHAPSARSVNISKKLGIGQQLLHEHMRKLEEAGLVRRDSEREFSLTTFGDTIAGLIDTYLFLSEHKEYFSDHKFGDIPNKFIRRIGDLSDCTFVRGISEVLELWGKVQSDAEQYIYMALPEVPLFMMENLVKRARELNNGIEIRCLFPKERMKAMKGELGRTGYEDLLKADVVRERKASKIQVAVVLSERQSLVFFPNQKGDTDMLSMFYEEMPHTGEGKSVRFHEWCLDYFRYKWHENDPVLVESARI